VRRNVSEFKDSQFMTSRDKELVLVQWKRFVEGGFSFEHFTDRIYKHLSLHASFIAHFDRRGFFSTYFEDPEATTKFLNQFDSDYGFRSVEYGSTWWLDGDYADINRAMCSVVEANKERLYEQLRRKVRGRDLAIASKLLEKHGIHYLLPRQGVASNQTLSLQSTSAKERDYA
jgi:hypothetical protein